MSAESRRLNVIRYIPETDHEPLSFDGFKELTGGDPIIHSFPRGEPKPVEGAKDTFVYPDGMVYKRVDNEQYLIGVMDAHTKIIRPPKHDDIKKTMFPNAKHL